MISKSFKQYSPNIGVNSFVAENAAIIGNVEIGSKVSIWYGAVLRGDSDRIVVGDETNIQDNTMVHPDEGYPVIIGKNVTIGHNCVIHGCTIKDGALIGMGSILLSGAVIEEGAVVAAGSVVSGKTVVPKNNLAIGNPLVIKGDIKEGLKESVKDGNKSYVEYGQYYLKSE